MKTTQTTGLINPKFYRFQYKDTNVWIDLCIPDNLHFHNGYKEGDPHYYIYEGYWILEEAIIIDQVVDKLYNLKIIEEVGDSCELWD